MHIFYYHRSDASGVVKRLYEAFRRRLFFYNQDGFFENSLATLAATNAISHLNVPISLTGLSQLQDAEQQFVIINLKARLFSSSAERSRCFRTITDRYKHSGLFINAAQASYMLGDEDLDNFDIIFKREPYRDRDRYGISDRNKAKIVPTMIYCPFVHAPRDNVFAKLYDRLRPIVLPCTNEEEVYEVGFSGADAAEHSLRRDVWQRIVDEGFTRIGGLQPNPRTKEPIPEALRGPRLKGKQYRDSLCAAKINLALDGIGEYTFRHQELLYLGKFILSSPSIRELELPMPLTEGEHYVAFNDPDDMVAKIRYYLAHEDERKRIAENGKRLFDEYYNPARHGREILAALQSVIGVSGAKENIEYAK